MRPSRLREIFTEGRVAVNGWISSSSTYAAEALSYAGFVTVDLQHGMFGIDAAIGLMQAVSAGPAMPMARCPVLDASVIGKLLDAGAYGIICPSVDTAAQAAEFVSACRYPPTGIRSFGPSRGLLYGGSDYVARADETIMAWAMIESSTALANVDAIAATIGLDGVFVGPNDLALSLGERPGTAVPPDVVEVAMGQILSAAHTAGIRAGIFCADGSMAHRLAGLGWDLVTPGNDVALLKAAASAAVATTRDEASSLASGGGY